MEIVHPELAGSIKYPGAFAKLSETPLAIKRRAPLIGEHNTDIYGKELGFSNSYLEKLQKAGII